MSMDKGNLGRNCYICKRDPNRECTSLFHARLYGYLACRGPEADREGFNSTKDEDMKEVLDEMGFEECKDLCIAGKFNGCFSRPKQTSTREPGIPLRVN